MSTRPTGKGLRNVRRGGGVLTTSLLTLGILVMISMLSLLHRWRWDVTGEGRYSLSPQSRQVLGGLTEPVELKAFFAADDGAQVDLRRRFDVYADTSPRLRYEFIDPDQKPGIAARYGIKQPGVVLAVMGDRHEKARDLTEAGLTNAILRLRRTHRVRVGFLTGHDERDPRGRQKDGILLAVDALRGANYDLSDFNLLTTPNALDSLDLVVCVGPISEPLPGELAALDAFLDRGGRFLALLDPNLPTRAGAGLAEFLRRWGIRVGADAVVDPNSAARLVGQDAFAPVVPQVEKSPITLGFRTTTFYPGVRSVALPDSLPAPARGGVLFRSGPGSWADVGPFIGVERIRLDPGLDTIGPIPLAAAVQWGDVARPRLVVFGDSDFITNAYWRLPGGGDLFLNAVAWLAEQGDEISMRAATTKERRVEMTAQQARLVWVTGLVLLPGLVLALGLYVAFRRRPL